MSEASTGLGPYILKAATASWGKVLLAALLVGVIYQFTYYDDGSRQKMALDAELQKKSQIEAELKATADAAENATRFEKEVQETQRQFEQITHYMPEKMAGAEMVTMVAEMSSRAGTKVVKTEPDAGKLHGDFFDTTELRFGLEGTFTEILTFLSNLSRTGKILTFSEIDLKSLNMQSGDAVKLAFEGTLVGYRYVRPKPGDKDKKPVDGAPAVGAPK